MCLRRGEPHRWRFEEKHHEQGNYFAAGRSVTAARRLRIDHRRRHAGYGRHRRRDRRGGRRGRCRDRRRRPADRRADRRRRRRPRGRRVGRPQQRRPGRRLRLQRPVLRRRAGRLPERLGHRAAARRRSARRRPARASARRRRGRGRADRRPRRARRRGDRCGGRRHCRRGLGRLQQRRLRRRLCPRRPVLFGQPGGSADRTSPTPASAANAGSSSGA